MLTLSHVNKSFGTQIILDDVSVCIERNAVVGLAGHSGSGKSTLLRCVQGLEYFDSGECQSDGESGFIFQDFQLFPHMTVLQNLVYAPSRKNTKQDPTKEALALLQDLALNEKANVYPATLSGGQKQRVALARSLMMSPDLLLCDEPTSGLNFAAIADVVTLLQTVKQRGVTIIIASHDLDFVTQISDRIILLKHGKIVKDLVLDEASNVINELKNFD